LFNLFSSDFDLASDEHRTKEYNKILKEGRFVMRKFTTTDDEMME